MIDQNNDPLADQPFSYREAKDGKIFLHYKNRLVMTLKGREAERFSFRIAGATEHEAQLLMAKATKNFKHGNERLGKSKQS